MKYLVNGVETELEPTGAEITKLPDRLLVKSKDGQHTAGVVRRGDEVLVSYQGQTYSISRVKAGKGGANAAESGDLRAPMPGMIVEVLVSAGDTVSKGQKLMILEAMKMQQPIVSPFDGTVDRLGPTKGTQVADGEFLVHVLEKSEN